VLGDNLVNFMLAHLQRFITFILLAATVGWLLFFWRSAPALALLGSLTIALTYTAIFALEFLLSSLINKSDPSPRPTFTQWLAAWAGEAVTAPKVFCWWQPFRSNALPDNITPQAAEPSLRGVVLIHGLFCNRGFWTPWLERLQKQGNAFIAVSLEPIFGSIDNYAGQIEAAVQKITRLTGVPPLMVCHSMGGLAAKAWLLRYKADARVHRVVTIATPHQGTWLARFGRAENARQMRQGSNWLSQLENEFPPDRSALFTCWYSNCDNIVFPALSATLPGADNRLVTGVAHVHMAFVPQVINGTLALLHD
jgi:predicted alpha/beta hydrolase family esterase